jgi:hypothetical protein
VAESAVIHRRDTASHNQTRTAGWRPLHKDVGDDVCGIFPVVSFLRIEIIALLSAAEEPYDVPLAAILDLDAIIHEHGTQYAHVLRAKAALFTPKVHLFNAILLVLGLLIHIALIVWTVQSLWNPALDAIIASDVIQNSREALENRTVFGHHCLYISTSSILPTRACFEAEPSISHLNLAS